MKNAVDAATNEREMRELDERLAAEEAQAQARVNINKSKQVLTGINVRNVIELHGQEREEEERKQREEEERKQREEEERRQREEEERKQREEEEKRQREEEERKQREEEERRQREEEELMQAEKRETEKPEDSTNEPANLQATLSRKVTLNQASLKDVVIKPGEEPTPEQAKEIAEQKKDLMNKVLNNVELAKRLYNKLDKDGDENIKRSEVGKIANDNRSIEGRILHRIMDLPDHASNKDWTKDAISKIYAAMDKDGKGGVSFARFMEYLREKEEERKVSCGESS